MDNDSGFDAVVGELLRVASQQPPDSLLPSTRHLQKRFRVSALTAQRALALLASKGLLVTRPGRGSYTAARRPATKGAELGWQTAALGSRTGLAADLEDLLAPTPAGLMPSPARSLTKACSRSACSPPRPREPGVAPAAGAAHPPLVWKSFEATWPVKPARPTGPTT